MLYLSWMLYAGGLAWSVWRSQWILGAAWLVGVPLLQWWYVRRFPKFSTALGYGPVTDEPVKAAGASSAASVTLYTAVGCPFCPLIEKRLDELKRTLGFSLRKIDVTARPGLLASKGIRSVPAVEIGARFLTGLVTSRELADTILQAGRETPTAHR